MHSTERALALVERELHVRLPRPLFAPGGHGPYDATVDPEALLDPRAAVVRGGEMLPDALPLAGDAAGNWLLLRFGPGGAVTEAVEWRTDGGWHPTELVPGFPSDAARLRARCAAALANGLQALAQAGEASLAQDLGVSRETFSDWLLDGRLVPDALRTPLRRLTGSTDAALFDQDWEGAAAAALRVRDARPELAWPGAVIGWFEEGRGASAAAAAGYAAALRAFSGTLDVAERFGRPGERTARVLAAAYERCGGDRAPDDGSLRAALAGARAVRVFHLAESDRLRGAGRHREAYAEALQAGWHRHVAIDMDDVLGRLGDAAEAAGAAAHAALARLHLRTWATTR
ncbi:hypothetical protein [Anaeromyxobacter oryzae]|uniref:HTH cro/C1-type domain-containing protein n=1 Tax=Anaeromyxobacter oryzae TaxID=2918170 RepID=A0ABN6MNY4_9BACT|nr:hypothetical protein [Anaeromyxobacter oryzae]BDG02675.1 hypothetical protein AMOR_16710 [Anaeromyxobacter oryzae]